MGFESFRVELRGGEANYKEAEKTIRTHLHARPDPQSPALKGSTFYLIDNGRHVLEVEVRDAPVRISCRFTLCHPPSVDSVFLELIRQWMLRLGMEARICDDVRVEDADPFSLADFAEFSSVAVRAISGRRMEWISAFSAEQVPATTNEVHERIILPRCQPVASLTQKR